MYQKLFSTHPGKGMWVICTQFEALDFSSASLQHSHEAMKCSQGKYKRCINDIEQLIHACNISHIMWTYVYITQGWAYN